MLGLDLGSTGSKGVLVDPASGAVLADVYRRTDGNPVEAAKRLVADLRAARPRDRVAAIGLTGSGRDAVATVMRAAYPELDGRLTVLNEIVAHAAAAVRFDADGGRSLSIVEIGGQDAKFINVRDGRVLESDMNRVCSAGTGSFLEEQALAHGLDDIAEFGALAVRSRRPPDLGQTCTVFVADVAAEALADGFTRDDIFAGLQYSVIKNYIGRVMGDRRFLDRVFFQGKPASNPSLARTLAAVTGREVVVPPNPGAMGALGIALLAARRRRGDALAAIARSRERPRRPPRGSTSRSSRRPASSRARAAAAATAVRQPLPARDRDRRGGRRAPPRGQRRQLPQVRRAFRGGRQAAQGCAQPLPRARRAAGRAAGRGCPWRRRRPARWPAAASACRRRTTWSTRCPSSPPSSAALGAEVEVLRPTIETLALGDRRCAAPGACAPVKIAHGLTEATGDAPLDALFAPAFINLPSHGAAGTYTCPIAQGTPQMLDSRARRRAVGAARGAPGALCRRRPTASPDPTPCGSSRRRRACSASPTRRPCAPPRPTRAPSGSATSAACTRSARGRWPSRAPRACRSCWSWARSTSSTTR